MTTFDQGVVDKYVELFGVYSTTKKNLKNLENIKDTIAEERFDIQKQAYEEKISQISPEINDLKSSIESQLEKLSSNFERLDSELNEVNGEIKQEKIMRDSGAISKEQYKQNYSKLQGKQKTISSRHREIKSQITALKKALSGEASNIFVKPSHIKSSLSNLAGGNVSESNPKGFSKDFNKGCLVILLIMILIPILGFLVITIKSAAFVVIPILGFIIVIAIFGKSVNFIQRIWK